MASNLESSIVKGSDFFFDFLCFICQENDRNTEADFYCTQCSKFYCGRCVDQHNYLFKKHTTLGKEKISSWPDVKVAVDIEEECQEHKGEKLTAFCEDHGELMCHVCHIYTHKNCIHVVLIKDKAEALNQRGEFTKLSAFLDTLHLQFIQKKFAVGESLQSFEKSHTQVCKKINALHTKIKGRLDHLKGETIKELDTLHATLKSSIQKDIAHCSESVQTIKIAKEDWQKIQGKSDILHFIMYIKCLDHTNKAFSILQAKIAEKDNTLSFQPDTTIDKTLSTSSGLGKILSNVKLKQHTGRSITSDATPTQAEPNAKKPSSTSSKQPDKAHTTSNTNNTDQVLHPLSSSSKISEILKVNLTNDVNDSDQVLHPVYILSEKPSAENQCHVKKSAAVSSSYSLPDISNKEGAMNKTSRESIPNKVINIISKAKYSVKVRSDKQTCNISGVCETYAGELLIMDQGNDKLKLLDKTYKVVAHYDLPYTPSSMCRIESLLVAVTLGNKEVHFIRVSKLPSMRLVHESTLKLHHACEGIAHHQGSLYITSGTALYHYTVDGTPLMEIYRNISYGDSDITSCAVSPDGNRIYLTNIACDQLVTLSRDGKVISTLTDTALVWRNLALVWKNLENSEKIPPGIHVTDSGYVFVCGGWSNTIVMVDREGRQKLAEVVTEEYGLDKPTLVYYNENTGALIVGNHRNKYIRVFKTTNM